MKVEFINVKYTGKIELAKSAIDELKKHKTLAIYTTTQFLHGIDKIIKQLEEQGIKIASSQPERTKSKMQILGCDIYHGNLKLPAKVDVYLYVGDGMFHPRALLFSEADSNSNKVIYVFNPKTNKLKEYDKREIENILKLKEKNLKIFLMADKVGVIVTTKPGQEHFHYVEKLKIKFPEKKFFTFVADGVDIREIENFPFVKSWVNTACPRLALEDALNTEKSWINVEEVLKL